MIRSASGTRRLWAVLRNVANTILASVRCRPASVLCAKLEQVVLNNHKNIVDEDDDNHAHRYAPNDSHKRSTITARFALLFIRRRRRCCSRCSRWLLGSDEIARVKGAGAQTLPRNVAAQQNIAAKYDAGASSRRSSCSC